MRPQPQPYRPPARLTSLPNPPSSLRNLAAVNPLMDPDPYPDRIKGFLPGFVSKKEKGDFNLDLLCTSQQVRIALISCSRLAL
jgi:hypothetical protein